MKKYVAELTIEERKQLEELINRGKVEGYKIQHAQVLLKADEGDHGLTWKDEDIANAFGCHVTTVENIRRRFIEFKGELHSLLWRSLDLSESEPSVTILAGYAKNG